jgi:hypothetical protein
MFNLICPICGTATSFSPAHIEGKGILLERSGEDHTQYSKVNIAAIIPYKYGEESYAILVCQSCFEYFIIKRDKYSEDKISSFEVVYPIKHKVAPIEIPEPIKGEFEEASLCFAVGAYRASVSMGEAALEALWREQKAKGLLELKEKGIISDSLYHRANEVRLWANVAKHELIPNVVSKEDAEQLLTYLETLLNTVYVEPPRLDSLVSKRKELEKK